MDIVKYTIWSGLPTLPTCLQYIITSKFTSHTMPYKYYLTLIPWSFSCTSSQLHSQVHTVASLLTPLERSPPTGLVVSSGCWLEQLPTGLPAHSPWLLTPNPQIGLNQQTLRSQNSFLTLILSPTQYLLSSPSYPELAMPSCIYQDNVFLRITQIMMTTHQLNYRYNFH